MSISERKEDHCNECGDRIRYRTEGQRIWGLYAHKKLSPKHGLTLPADDPYNKRITKEYKEAKRALGT